MGKVNKRIYGDRGLKELDQLRVTCKCGHVMIIPVFKDSIICNHCGRKVLNNTQLYFKHKIRQTMDVTLKEKHEWRKR